MDLGLQIGDILQLSPVSGEGRYRVRLIGLSPERSLLVTAPDAKREPLELRPGQEFAVRAFAKDAALTFITTVERICQRPYPYLHLAYPQVVERASERISRRARVRLAGRASRDEGGAEKVSIGDLSREGAMVWCNTQLGRVGDSLTLWLDFQQTGRSPIEAAIELPCEIRNVHEQPADPEARWRFGIEFTLMTDLAADALHAYLSKRLGQAKW